LPLALLAVFGVRYAWKKRAQLQREAGYQSTLRSYSEVLKPGMTRKEMEDYLRAKKIGFRQMRRFHPERLYGARNDQNNWSRGQLGELTNHLDRKPFSEIRGSPPVARAIHLPRSLLTRIFQEPNRIANDFPWA
jgi:hypothetical protein